MSEAESESIQFTITVTQVGGIASVNLQGPEMCARAMQHICDAVVQAITHDITGAPLDRPVRSVECNAGPEPGRMH